MARVYSDKGRAGPEGGRNRARPGGRVGRGPACRRAGHPLGRAQGGSGANRIAGDPVALAPFGRGPACRRAGRKLNGGNQ